MINNGLYTEADKRIILILYKENKRYGYDCVIRRWKEMTKRNLDRRTLKRLVEKECNFAINK